MTLRPWLRRLYRWWIYTPPPPLGDMSARWITEHRRHYDGW